MRGFGKGRAVWVLVASCALAFAARPAAAALTPSEATQAADFVQSGDPSKAPRVRALVGRPDLTRAEAAEPLARGFSRARFDEKHRRFAEALLFGPGSEAARSDLTPAIVTALLARAGNAMQRLPAAGSRSAAFREGERTAAQEIRAIHRFVGERIANAGKPPADGHDAAAGIRDDALRASAELYGQHLSQHARWFLDPGPLPRELALVRAQAALTLMDLGRGLMTRTEMAGALGLQGARRVALERYGVLIDDGGTASEARLAEAVGLLDLVPRATDGVALWLIYKAPTLGLYARGRLLSTSAVLGTGTATAGGGRPHLFPEGIATAPADPALAAAALTVARSAVRRGLEMGVLPGESARLAVHRAETGGAKAYLATDLVAGALSPAVTETSGLPGASAELVLGHALRLFLLDAPAALRLCAQRAAEGRLEPLEQAMLALTVAATGKDEAFSLGRPASSSSIEALPVTGVKRDQGLVRGFTVDGKRYEFVRVEAGTTLTIDGKAPEAPAGAAEPKAARPAAPPGG